MEESGIWLSTTSPSHCEKLSFFFFSGGTSHICPPPGLTGLRVIYFTQEQIIIMVSDVISPEGNANIVSVFVR